MEPLFLRSTSRGDMMNMLAIRYFFLMLETEELISKIDLFTVPSAILEMQPRIRENEAGVDSC